MTTSPHWQEVVLVTTSGQGSMDLYGQQLARHSGARSIELPRHDANRNGFGAPWLSRTALAQLKDDVTAFRELRGLRGVPGIPHFTHHHTARYATALRRPYILTVHDLIRWLDIQRPEPLIAPPTRRDRFLLELDCGAIRRAAHVICISDFTGRDLIRHLHVTPDKLSVVRHGVDHAVFRPVSRRLVDGPYVLYVGSEHPRKNLAVLLEAFAEVKRETGWGDLRLVKVGPAGGGDGGYRELTMATVDRLGLTLGVDVLIVEGRVPVEDLAAYYSGALCLVQPSRYEGFGMTALEAMACGCPTIVSRATSLPEVVGDAALAVPPDDVAGFASAIRSVVSDRTLAKDLAACAVERAARFSWERCAKETRAVYEKVLAQL